MICNAISFAEATPNNIILWEVLVPTIKNNKPIRLRYHKVWDKKVHEIAGGLTIGTPNVGYWRNQGEVIRERMIPVKIACTYKQLMEILKFTKKYYEQEAIFYYRITEQIGIYK